MVVLGITSSDGSIGSTGRHCMVASTGITLVAPGVAKPEPRWSLASFLVCGDHYFYVFTAEVIPYREQWNRVKLEL